MSDRPHIHDGQGEGHAGHGALAMLACCIPMVLVFVLIGLKVL